MKKIVLILFMIIVIISMSFCSAIADSNSAIGSFKELSHKIQSSDDNVIILSKDYINNDNYDEEGIRITGNNLIIKGDSNKNITLDASHSSRIFNAKKCENVTFENINFKNANISKGAGGAVYLGDVKSNSVVNCTFENCYSAEFGGALDGNAYDSTFINCSSKYHGGAIFEGSSDNCKFIDCFSTSCGGAISYKNAINCSFLNCYSYWRGGALYLVDAIDCDFVNCWSSEGGSMYEGSAFACYFENSIAKNGNGGGICGGSVIGCKFVGCSVNNGQGAAMYKGTALDCDFGANECYDVVQTKSGFNYNFKDSTLEKFLEYVSFTI